MRPVTGVWVAASLLCLGLPLAAHAQKDTLPLAEYQKLLRDYQRTAKHAKPTDAETIALAEKLRAVKAITVKGDTRIPVDLSPDADALTTTPPPPSSKKPAKDEETPSKTPASTTPAQNRAALLTSLVIPDEDAKPKTSGDAQAQAATILARPEFHVETEKESDKTPAWIKSIKEWFARQGRALERWWRKFWEGLFPRSSIAPGSLAGLAYFVRFLLYFAVVVAVIVGLYFLTTYLSNRQPKAPKKGRAQGTGLDLDLDGVPDPLAYARELAARSDFREAVRYVYIASLRRLAGSGLVTLQENRTNWEYQGSLRSRSQSAYDTLLPGTRLFDRIWYGRQNATQSEYEQVVNLYESLPAPVVTASASSSGAASGSSDAARDTKGNSW